MKCIVEIEEKVWLAPWEGDPGRTLVRENARQFETLRSAKMAITAARKYRPFKNAKITTPGGDDV
jgi:hypothetical protein